MASLPAVGNITSFLDSLTDHQRNALYDSPWTCQAVFRSLPPLAKSYVLDLLLIDFPVPQEVVNSRCADIKKHGKQHNEVVRRLLSLNIFIQGKIGNQLSYQLHPTFQSKLRWAISTGGRLLPSVPAEVQDKAPTSDSLDQWAHSQWESLQMYLLDLQSPGPVLPRDVPLEPLDFHNLLTSAQLIRGKRMQRTITDAGFQFLLRDSHKQLWIFLTRYILDTAAASGSQDLSALMSFLMQLGFMRIGQAYPLSDLTAIEQKIAGHMMQLGLLMPFQYRGRVYYCPTRLASSLCAAGSSQAVADTSGNADIAGGYIIVESNYKVNAWTTSRVQKSLLELFCRCEAKLPNFWVGSLTHESVNSAFAAGIAATEIIAYLQAHAHPHLVNRSPVIPENVSDQVQLWELETMRLKATPAVFYDNFENLELFQAVLDYAQKQRLVVWCDVDKKCFAAKDEGHELIKEAIKTVKSAQQAGRPIPTLV